MSDTDLKVDREKDVGTVERIEDVDADAAPLSRAEERRLIRRLDLRLIGAAGFGYSISLMDRTNVGMAAITGMLEDLNLVPSLYSLIVLVFFIPYVLFQPPATVLIRKLGPPKFLSSLVLAWGVLMIGSGFVKGWQDLLAIRLILGVFAAGYFPAATYLISAWYTRFEVQKRFSVFYCIGVVIASLSGILSFGLAQMNGVAGLGGWSWIFILEGTITCCIGFACFFLIVDFPDKAHRSWRFLTREECAFFVKRLDRDRADGGAPEAFTLGRFLKPALDPKIWAFALLFGCLTTNTYAMAYFGPLILTESMGFSVGATQCLTFPPWVFAGLLMFATSWLGDKYRTRAPVIVFNALISIIGIPVMGFATNSGARYFGAFLTVAGANANVPAVMAWQANNIRGQWKRAFSSATLVGCDGVGGIVSSLVFSLDAPSYHPGLYTALGANLLILLTVGILSAWFTYCNRQADQGQRVIEDSDEFRYTI